MSEFSPYLIEFKSIGSSTLGFITIAEYPMNIPFKIKRVYWIYDTPSNQERGFHAHKELNQLIFAVSGKILFNTEDRNGVKQQYTLDKPNVGLFIPPLVWRQIVFEENSVLLCLASEIYIEEEYIRDYNEFKKINQII